MLAQPFALIDAGKQLAHRARGSAILRIDAPGRIDTTVLANKGGDIAGKFEAFDTRSSHPFIDGGRSTNCVKKGISAVVAALADHQAEVAVCRHICAAGAGKTIFAGEAPPALIHSSEIGSCNGDLAGACQGKPLIGEYAYFPARRQIDSIDTDPPIRSIGKLSNPAFKGRRIERPLTLRHA